MPLPDEISHNDKDCVPALSGLNFEQISYLQYKRIALVYDKLTPYVSVVMEEDVPKAILEVLDPVALGTTAMEFQLYNTGLSVMNDAIRREIVKIKPGSSHQLVSGDIAASMAALLPGTFDAAFFKAPMVDDYGWQYFPPGFYIDLTPEGSDALQDALGIGVPALIALLVEMGVPKWLATLVASLLATAGAEYIKLLRAYSDKGSVKVKFLLPFYTPVILPA